MLIRSDGHRAKRTAIAGIFVASALLLGACGEDPVDEADTEVEEVTEEAVEEPLDEETLDEEPLDEEPTEDESDLEELAEGEEIDPGQLYGDVESYEGQSATVRGEVDEIISEMAFTVVGGETTPMNPLLVLHDGSAELTADSPVSVTGVVNLAFDVAGAEEEVGLDLDDSLFDAYLQEPYLGATSIDTTVE